MSAENRESSKTENMGEYEREKIEYTIKDLKLALGLMENYLKMIDFCNEKGIEIGVRKNEFDRLRMPGAIMGPDNDLNKLQHMFMNGQTELAAKIPAEYVRELDDRVKSEL